MTGYSDVLSAETVGRIRPEKLAVHKPRVIVSDDHQLVVAGLVKLLATDCTIVGTANDGESLLTEIRRLHPNIVLMDMSMPPMNGIDLIRRIKKVDASVSIIVVTINNDPDLAAEAFRAGASAYVLKECAASELLEAIRHAMDHQSYVTPLIAGDVLSSLMRPGYKSEAESQLTNRQREVLRLLAEGKSMKEAASALKVAARTVAFHKYRMMRQLNIKSSAELVRFAVAQKIV
jgi:DNA-binding NarL/FixJ family response regulator